MKAFTELAVFILFPQSSFLKYPELNFYHTISEVSISKLFENPKILGGGGEKRNDQSTFPEQSDLVIYPQSSAKDSYLKSLPIDLLHAYDSISIKQL